MSDADEKIEIRMTRLRWQSTFASSDQPITLVGCVSSLGGSVMSAASY
ncbi:hypothetical protein DSM14862_04106 (plasmid) [Sulfitobacter indolifex]|nr:hypothetical protein DSM14862_04106 [Sulfitobacter indolifex]